MLGAGERIEIRANRIEFNGATHGFPVCGLFVLDAEGIIIDGNRILDNGRLTEAGEAEGLQLGRRGGIYLANVSEPFAPLLEFGHGADPMGSSAALITNNVVSQPFGRALTVAGLGRIAVHGNQFRSGNVGIWGLLETLGSILQSGEEWDEAVFNAIDLFAGSAVAVVDLGLPNELLTLGEQGPSFEKLS